MAWGTVFKTRIFPWRGGISVISGVVALSGKSRGSISSIGGALIWGGDSVIGVFYLMSVPLEETTHTCAKKDGFRNRGTP
jgi:hypothetical protein